MGDIYTEVDQLGDSLRSYQRALDSFRGLPPSQAHAHHHYLLVIYNMLGLSYLNREDLEQGLGCLGKAYKLYHAYHEVNCPDCYNNRSISAGDRIFRFL